MCFNYLEDGEMFAGIIIGFIIGNFFGLFTAALLLMSGRDDDDEDSGLYGD